MSYTYPQQDNVLSSIEYLLQERGIDIDFTYEEKEELYKEITECVCRHHLNNIQKMMTERLDVDLYTSRSMLDKMYLSLDKNEKPILEEFNKKVSMVQFYERKDREEEVRQLRRIMRAKHWKDEFMDGADYTICDGIIGFMDKDNLREFKQFMNKLEQTDSEIREHNIKTFGVMEDKKSILLYLGENDRDNQQDFYHKIQRDTKEYITLNQSDDLNKLLAECKNLIQLKKDTYQHVAVAGEGFWANLANLVAHQNDLPTLLINPLMENTDIEFPLTNSKAVNILLDKPNDLTKYALPDNWRISYLYLRQIEIRERTSKAMARVCWDSWTHTTHDNDEYEENIHSFYIID